MNIIIPMAGLGSRFTTYGFSTNKYLLPINIEKTKMIEKAILTLNIPRGAQFIFILREENGEDQELREYLQHLCKTYSYQCIILSVDHLTEGPASTAYLAKDYINNEIPLIISNSDQILDWNFESFINTSKNHDGCVLTYTPNYELIIGDKDKHSFVRFDENTNKPVEFVEKTVISKEALVGVHYYKQGTYFIKSAEYLFENNIRAPNGEFYLSYTYQALLNMGYNIGAHCLYETEHFYPVGEPEDYFTYYNSKNRLFMTDIENYNIINESNLFKISIGKKDQTILIENSLIILLNNHPDCFTSGHHVEYTFVEDTYYLQVPEINVEENKQVNIDDFIRGWLIGDFEPCVKRTTDLEVAVLHHKRGEKWGFHYHSEAREINILLSGKMIINNIPIKQNSIFIFEQNMISCPIFMEDCIVLCIKIPSIPTDKYII